MRRLANMGLYIALGLMSFVLISPPTALAQEKKLTGYKYRLEEILKEAEEGIRRAKEAIRQEAIKKRNEEREAKVRAHVAEGRSLMEEGRYEEAIKEWQKALEITKDPEMKDYIKDSEKRAREKERAREREERERQRRLRAQEKERIRKLNEQAKVFYDQGVSLYKSKNYEQAKAKFEQATQIVPHYLKTDYYLKRISEDIQREKQHLEAEKKRQEELAKGIEGELRLEDLTYKTERECLDVLGTYPDDKEAFDNLVNLYLLMDELFYKAKELYKNKDYQGAIQEYNKVLLIDPENKKAKMGIKRARSRMK